jgi:F0F1-type ATP synthase assembly protein I
MNSDKATEGVQDDPYTLGEVLISMAMLLAVVIIYVFVAGFLDDQPHGMQIATLIGYSGAIFIFTFRRSHYVSTRYSVRAPYVQRQLPRLLLIHCVYLLALYVLGGWIPRMRLPRLDLVETFGLAFMGASQVALSRKILSRAKDQGAR